MKRVTLMGAMALTLLLGAMTPAHAILGLGKCEKVKKELLGLEKQFTDVHEKGLGYDYTQVYFKTKKTIWEPDAASAKMFRSVINNDPIPKIWKLATNNPKCFTNTQNMQVKSMQNFTYQTYFSYPVYEDKYQNSGECKTLMERNDYTYDKKKFFEPSQKTKSIISKCKIGTIGTIKTTYLYKSLYEY